MPDGNSMYNCKYNVCKICYNIRKYNIFLHFKIDLTNRESDNGRELAQKAQDPSPVFRGNVVKNAILSTFLSNQNILHSLSLPANCKYIQSIS